MFQEDENCISDFKMMGVKNVVTLKCHNIRHLHMQFQAISFIKCLQVTTHHSHDSIPIKKRHILIPKHQEHHTQII